MQCRNYIIPHKRFSVNRNNAAIFSVKNSGIAKTTEARALRKIKKIYIRRNNH